MKRAACESCGESRGHKPGCGRLFRRADLGPLFAPPPIADPRPTRDEEGERLKAEAIAGHEERHPDLLTAVRLAMRRLWIARSRDDGDACVTGDDAAEWLDTAFPGTERRTFLGAVFFEGGWEKVCDAVGTPLMVKSRQPRNRARLLSLWRWRQKEAK